MSKEEIIEELDDVISACEDSDEEEVLCVLDALTELREKIRLSHWEDELSAFNGI